MDSLEVGIRVEENPYSLPTESIFSMAARNNPKRSFLFVSKLIGKHIPVRPQVPQITGFLLASRLAEHLGISVNQKRVVESVNMLSNDIISDYQRTSYQFPGKALFIGFAETATGLGHSAFNSFAGEVGFIHTTRENIEGSKDTLYFTEDHCHAPNQRCLISDTSLIEDNNLLVLIDDEITTGNTCLNIIRTIQEKYPQKRYAILTILDWRSEESIAKYQQVEEEIGVKIEVLSLLKGQFWHKGVSPVINNSLNVLGDYIPPIKILQAKTNYEVIAKKSSGKKTPYLGYTGRFGLNARNSSEALAEAKIIGAKLSQTRTGKSILCLGTGEFMYFPFIIASHMGEGVMVQSTTRSPVHPYLGDGDYAVKRSIIFEDPFRPGINNYIYNIPENQYDQVFVFWEKEVLPEKVKPLVLALDKQVIKDIVFVSFCN